MTLYQLIYSLMSLVVFSIAVFWLNGSPYWFAFMVVQEFIFHIYLQSTLIREAKLIEAYNVKQ